MAVSVTDLQNYAVKKNTPVSLTIIIGYAQSGGSDIQWNGSDITPANRVVQNLSIGTAGQDLTNTILSCITTVVGNNPDTNTTSVTYQFSGGVEDQEFPYSVDLDADGGQAQYCVTFRFVQGGQS